MMGISSGSVAMVSSFLERFFSRTGAEKTSPAACRAQCHPVWRTGFRLIASLNSVALRRITSGQKPTFFLDRVLYALGKLQEVLLFSSEDDVCRSE